MVAELYVAVSKSGKTLAKVQRTARLLLADAARVNDGLSKVNLIIAHDPPQTDYPLGQYARYWPGGDRLARFESFSEFLRQPSSRTKISIITSQEFPTERACEFALSVGNVVIDADEMDKVLPAGRALDAKSATHLMVQEGRKYSCAFIGTARRVGKINADARDNIQRIYIGPMSDGPHRKEAEAVLQLGPGVIPWDRLPRYHFVDGSPAQPGDIYLTTFKNGRRVRVAKIR